MTSQLNFIASTHESGSIRLREFSPEARKAEGMQRAYKNSVEWRAEAEPAAWLAISPLDDGMEITTDYLTPRLPLLTVEQRAKWIGPFVGALARWGWLTWTGKWETSKRESLASSPLKVWRVNRAAVQAGIPEKRVRAA